MDKDTNNLRIFLSKLPKNRAITGPSSENLAKGWILIASLSPEKHP
jgi:hypothetical protein